MDALCIAKIMESTTLLDLLLVLAILEIRLPNPRSLNVMCLKY